MNHDPVPQLGNRLKHQLILLLNITKVTEVRGHLVYITKVAEYKGVHVIEGHDPIPQLERRQNDQLTHFLHITQLTEVEGH